jgi:hypothetical protein
LDFQSEIRNPKLKSPDTRHLTPSFNIQFS